MERELEKEIDLVLAECREKGLVIQNDQTSDIRDAAIQHAKTLGFIQPRGRNSFELTSEGLEVIKSKGIQEYQSDLESKEEKETIIQNLTIKQLKGNIFHLKYWLLILLLSGVVGFVTGNFETILKWFASY